MAPPTNLNKTHYGKLRHFSTNTTTTQIIKGLHATLSLSHNYMVG